jgi:hypothetical protein
VLVAFSDWENVASCFFPFPIFRWRKSWCQFHQRCMYTFFVQNFGAKLNITREKLLERHSYEKCVRKMLMKLTTGRQKKQSIFVQLLPKVAFGPLFQNFLFVCRLRLIFQAKCTRTHCQSHHKSGLCCKKVAIFFKVKFLLIYRRKVVTNIFYYF